MRWNFLDRITELIPGDHASGLKGVTSSEDYFADHFPGLPILPGVIQIEALAQLAGKLIEVSVYTQHQRWAWPILTMVKKAKFRRFVRPGDQLELNVHLQQLRDESALCRCFAMVGDEKVTEAELLFVFNPTDLQEQKAQIELEEVERKALGLLWHGYEKWASAAK